MGDDETVLYVVEVMKWIIPVTCSLETWIKVNICSMLSVYTFRNVVKGYDRQAFS